MITFVGIKPERLLKQTGNNGIPYIEFVAAAYGHDFLEVDSFEEIPKDKPIIIFSDHGETNIRDFDFPDDSYYVIGHDWSELDIAGHQSVYIPTVNTKRFRALFGSQAASIIAWECYVRKL